MEDGEWAKEEPITFWHGFRNFYHLTVGDGDFFHIFINFSVNNT